MPAVKEFLLPSTLLEGNFHAYVSFVAFFELLEHDIQRQIIEHKVTRILIEFAEHPKGRVVVSVNEGQVFDVEKRQDVCSVALIDRNARISFGKR